MKQSVRISAKGKLSSTLKNWLPLLQANITDLQEKLGEQLSLNPLCRVVSNYEANDEPKDEEEREYGEDDWFEGYERERAATATIDYANKYKSLYAHLLEQIDKRLFPTELSQNIAYKIIENIDESGFYEGDDDEIASELGVSVEELDKVRKRFAYLSPNGIGAKDLVESFEFQLLESNCTDEIYDLASQIINSLDNLSALVKHPDFKEATALVRKFKNPPAIEFLENSQSVIPDIFVHTDEEKMEVRLNDAFYPEIIIENVAGLEKNDFVKPRIKEAKDMIDAIAMRKATLYKVGMMIVEYQYDYFSGGLIRPMKLQHLADELGLNVSTVSRAISSKYLSSNRGVSPLKSFFSTAITEETSSAAIKEMMKELINVENKLKPLSDEAMLAKVEARFSLKMERRTLTKYRIALNIPSSAERKKLYQVG
jgi:RNA polymerase sigma-54 factor